MRNVSFDPNSSVSQSYWKHEIRLKQFYTSATDWTSVLGSMNRVADALASNPLFDEFWALGAFRVQGDLVLANELLDELYDYCDDRRIWIG